MKITFAHLGREHLGVMYLSSALKKAGHDVSLAYDPGLFGPDDNVFNIPRLERLFNQEAHVLDVIRESRPDLLALTVYTSTYPWALGIARKAKRMLGIPTVFGGIHATLVPETVMSEDAVDFVIVGEGDEALLELAAALSAGSSDFAIPNLWHKKDGEIIENRPRPPIPDLDRLPLPDKSLFENDVRFRDDYMIVTGRGCAYSCSYCCESFLNRLYQHRFHRRRGVDSIMDELVAMQRRYRFKRVMFNDALFFTDTQWLKELLKRYVREVAVPFRCFGKVNSLDAEVARLLKDSGCYCIEFGMQTVNPVIKKTILHRNETLAQAEQAFRTCDRFGLRYDIDHMFGLPGESEQDHIDGARFYNRLACLNRLKCHNLTYFPKLAILETACERGLVSDAERDDITHGRIGDFFHSDSIKDIGLKHAAQNFGKLYKLMPIIPTGMLSFILDKKLHRLFRFIPGFLVILGQLLVAMKGRDARYLIYFNYYPLRIWRAVQRNISFWRRDRVGKTSVKTGGSVTS